MVLTKGLLLLLLTSVASLPTFPQINDNDDRITVAVKKVYQTWDPTKEVKIDNHIWLQGRSERFNQSVSFGSGLLTISHGAVEQYCNMPGYTGANCEFPICEATNPDVEISQPSQGTMTDALMLASCSSSMTTVLDQDMIEITVAIESNSSVKPRVTLFTPYGDKVYPSNEIINTQGYGYEAIFIPQPAGTYSVQASTLNPADNAACFIIVRAVTNLLTRGGFIPHSQELPADRNDQPEENSVSGQPTTFVVHAANLRSPGTLVSVTIFENFNVMSRPQQLLVRYNCGYEYFIENFYCTDVLGDYYYRVDGIDFWGNKFSRIGVFNCFPPAVTTTVPPVTPSVDPGPRDCRNGGALLTNKDGTRYCFCRGLFTGRDCGSNLCLNGGTRTGTPVCLCPLGFSGSHCEDVKCTQREGHGFGVGHPRLILIVRLKQTMSDAINQVITQIQIIYNTLQASDPGYMRSFGLVLFNNKKIILSLATNRIEDVIGTLQNSTKQPEGDCRDTVFSAIEEALSSFAIPNGSPIYVFTDAVPSDEQEFETIFHLTTYWRAPIYVTLIEPPASAGCTLDLYHTSYLKLSEMTRRTSGHVFYLNNGTGGAAGRVFFAHLLHVFHRSSLVHSYDAQECRLQPQYQPISVDKQLNELVITAVGKGLTLTMLLPNGTSVVVIPTYMKADISFWSISKPTIGQWMFSLTSSAPSSECGYRIYSTQSRSGQTQEYNLFWSFTPGLMWDGPVIQPLAYEPLGLVAHMNNYNLLDPSKVFAELIVYKQSTTGRENVFASNGIWRDQCDYTFYFPQMTCQYPNELLYFSVFVRDELGTMIQRSGVAFCSVAIPTMQPPTDCQNGGVQITTNDNATVCYCPPDWSGDKCQLIVCQNGGTPSQTGGGSWCQCPAGHTGKYCETVTCIAEGTGEEFSPQNRDLAFVVDMTIYGAQSLQALKNYISTLIRDVRLHHPEWIANYVLVGYNSTWTSVLAAVRRYDTARFVQAVSDAFDTLEDNQDKGCKSFLYHGLAEALDYVRQDAYVVVLHASAPQDLNTEAYRAYNMIVDKRITVNAYFAYSMRSNGSELRCNASFNEFVFLTALTEVNQGRAYPVENSNFHLVLPMIPTFYLSGMVYKKAQSDCTSSPNIVYFPIDSYTQTIQLNAIGYNNQISLYRPDGSLFPPADGFEFIDDMTQTGWRVAEYRKACDREQDWEPVGPQYCAKFTLLGNSWQDARTFCHQFNGFLIDELNADMTGWIQEQASNTAFWIGLYRNKANVFYWDTPSGDPLPFDNTYSNWDTDAAEPSGNMTKLCVMRTKQGKWRMEVCNTTLAFICEKHKYDPTFEPSDLLDETLPPGKWYVRINTTATPASFPFPLTGCEVEVRVQSSIQVFPEYVLDEHADVSNGDATSGSDKNRFITYLYGEGQGNSPAVLKYANLYTYDNMSMQAAATYERRSGCTYPWLSQTWNCPNYEDINNRFAVIHSGEDQAGQTFQRITTGHCSLPRTTCKNDGIIYAGVCVCADYWTGASCEIPQCVNNGVLNAKNNTCSCPDGYTGFACQYDLCTPKVPATFSNNQKTFVVIVEMTLPNKPAVQQLADNIADLVNNVIQKNKSWFKNAMLVTINGSKAMDAVVYQMDQFVAAVQQLPGKITDSGTTCGAPLYMGVVFALRDAALVTPASVILIITRSTVNDVNLDSDGYVTSLIADFKPQIYYLAVDDTERICTLTVDHENVKRMSRFALETGGNFFVLPTNAYIQFLRVYLPSLYQSELITTPSLLDNQCKDVQWFAQVDYYMSSFLISTFTSVGALSVIDPRNDIMPIEVLYSNKKTRLLKVETVGRPGMYTIRMNSPTTCFVQVRGISPVIVNVGYVWQDGGASTLTHTDEPQIDPAADVDNVMIFHLQGTQTWQGILTYSELVNPISGSVLVTPLYKRQNCSYEYYSNPFKCLEKSFLVLVNGMDDKGQNFRREVTLAYCRNIINKAEAAAPKILAPKHLLELPNLEAKEE